VKRLKLIGKVLPIKDTIDGVINDIFGKQHPLLPKLIQNWGKIVGAKFSNMSNPYKIVRIKEKGKQINVLHINIENSVVAMEFTFQQDIILERIAVFFGFRAIEQIKINRV
jgi:hypothetical protein